MDDFGDIDSGDIEEETGDQEESLEMGVGLGFMFFGFFGYDYYTGDSQVFVTDGHRSYHRDENCPRLPGLRIQQLSISRSEAIHRGYSECELCGYQKEWDKMALFRSCACCAVLIVLSIILLIVLVAH